MDQYFVIVFEDGYSKLSKVFGDDVKQGFDNGVVENVFHVTDPRFTARWNGEEFEDLDKMK